MSLEATDKECAAVATAPRVSLADIEGAIAARFDIMADDALVHASFVMTSATHEVPDVIEQLGLLSLCVLVMKNGFTIVGKSACASPDNFNAELGKKLAYEDAIRQLWPLMGFALRDKLSQSSA